MILLLSCSNEEDKRLVCELKKSEECFNGRFDCVDFPRDKKSVNFIINESKNKFVDTSYRRIFNIKHVMNWINGESIDSKEHPIIKNKYGLRWDDIVGIDWEENKITVSGVNKSYTPASYTFLNLNRIDLMLREQIEHRGSYKNTSGNDTNFFTRYINTYQCKVVDGV